MSAEASFGAERLSLVGEHEAFDHVDSDVLEVVLGSWTEQLAEIMHDIRVVSKVVDDAACQAGENVDPVEARDVKWREEVRRYRGCGIDFKFLGILVDYMVEFPEDVDIAVQCRVWFAHERAESLVGLHRGVQLRSGVLDALEQRSAISACGHRKPEECFTIFLNLFNLSLGLT